MDLSILPPLVDFFFLEDEEEDAFALPGPTINDMRYEGLSGDLPVSAFLVVTFLYMVFASPSSEKTNPIMHSCSG